jgi:hypothetical protein
LNEEEREPSAPGEEGLEVRTATLETNDQQVRAAIPADVRNHVCGPRLTATLSFLKVREGPPHCVSSATYGKASPILPNRFAATTYEKAIL